MCQIRSYSQQFIYHTAFLTCFIEHDSDCRSESFRGSCNQWNKKCTQPYTMYYSNNDWYVCASCTKALRFQSTSAANKLQAWTRLNVLPFSLQLVTPLKKQCLTNLENTQRIIRFSCNEQNFKRHLCSKTHEKFRLVVNLFIVITVFRDQKSNVLRCTPAATMHRDSFVFDY